MNFQQARDAADKLLDGLSGREYRKLLADETLADGDISDDDAMMILETYGPRDHKWIEDEFNDSQLLVSAEEIYELLFDPIASAARVKKSLAFAYITYAWPDLFDAIRANVAETQNHLAMMQKYGQQIDEYFEDISA